MTPTDKNTPLPALEILKRQAKELRCAKQAQNTPITHSQALEAIAERWGFRDWNTVCAKAAEQHVQSWAAGQKVRGQYLGHGFTGHLKSAHPATGGKWQITVIFDDAVDVVQSDAFSNLRKQVRVLVGKSGISHQKTSDGEPHMLLERA